MRCLSFLLLGSFLQPAAGQPAADAARFEERHHFPAAEAVQAVAVDADYFYAISNHAIGKYDKETGEKVGEWTGEAGGPILHLNSGTVVDGRLYCAHSNFPGVPMVSSVEIWDTATMEHVGTHSFGIYMGSGTWIDTYDGDWWMAFAHYAGRGGEPGKAPRWTSLVRLDANWQPRASWIFPDTVVARFMPHSTSGGVWGEDGLLYVTGHDRPEVYVLRLPRAGSVLELVEVLPARIQGQGIAWDRTVPGTLYGIRRSSREVVVSSLHREQAPARD